MAASQTEIESQVIELSAEAFDAFCEDISGMFGVDMECAQQEVTSETVKSLKKRFKKLVAVNSVKTEDVLNGTFRLVFDQGGLLTLSGVIVMLPENRIREEIKRGSDKDVEKMSDAIGEAGNLLIGSWNRVFREELEGHGHFVLTSTFIGKPWDQPEETIGLAGDEEFIFVPYEMTIDPYPAFSCGIIFPKTIFDGTSESDAEDPPSADQTDAEEDTEEKTKEEAKEQSEEESKDKAEEEAGEQAEDRMEEEPEASAEQNSGDVQTDESAAKQEREAPVEAKNDDVDTETSGVAVEEKQMTAAESKDQPVSETIQRMTQSPAGLPGEPPPSILAICAEEIMDKDVVWGSPDDSVQQALMEMQEHNTGYMMIGRDGVLEGILSNSNITGAISPYLRPAFAKWRRPLDDATLNIRVKWIMSRPVRTVKPETSLVTIMGNMCRFGQRAFPVVDEQGKVRGLVTVFDIFKLLSSFTNISMVGESPEAHPLAQFDLGVGEKVQDAK